MSKKILTLAFLFPLGENDNNMLMVPYDAVMDFNKFVARICKRKTCHVELVFEDGMAFSIFAGSNLFFKPRSFSNPQYRMISLLVTHKEYADAYKYCLECARSEITFTDVGMCCAYLQICPCVTSYTPSKEVGHTFCSKIVTEVLLQAKIREVEGLTPCYTTPSMLYDSLEPQVNNRCIISTVAFKRDLLKNHAVLI